VFAAVVCYLLPLFVECVNQRVEDEDKRTVGSRIVCKNKPSGNICPFVLCKLLALKRKRLNYEDTLAYLRRSYEVY